MAAIGDFSKFLEKRFGILENLRYSVIVLALLNSPAQGAGRGEENRGSARPPISFVRGISIDCSRDYLEEKRLAVFLFRLRISSSSATSSSAKDLRDGVSGMDSSS